MYEYGHVPYQDASEIQFIIHKSMYVMEIMLGLIILNVNYSKHSRETGKKHTKEPDILIGPSEQTKQFPLQEIYISPIKTVASCEQNFINKINYHA